MFSLLSRTARLWNDSARTVPPRLRVESLEDRSLLAAGITASIEDGVLKILGTNSADIIKVYQRDDYITVGGVEAIQIGGETVEGVSADEIDSILILGYNGNDTIDCDTGGEYTSDVSVPVTVRSGPGNDRIWGGSADDVLNGQGDHDKIYGMGGDDYLYGGSGNDTLDTGGGGNFAYGQGGADTFNAYLSDGVDGGTENDTFNLTIYFSDLINYNGAKTINLAHYRSTSAGTDTINLKLNAGDFAEEFLNPLIDELWDTMEYFTPIVDMLDTQIPGVSQIYSDGYTFGELIDYKGYDVSEFLKVYHAVRDLQHADLSGTVDLGRFTLTGLAGRTPNFVRKWRADAFAQLNSSVLDDLHEYDFTNLQFLENPNNAMKLVLGQKATLFEVDVPYFRADLRYGDSFSWPTNIPGVDVKTGLDAELFFSVGGETFGLDSTGLYDGNWLDGLYVTNPGATVSLTVTGRGGVSVGFNDYFSLGGAGVYGSVGGTLRIGLEDEDGDGKIYLWEAGSFDGSVNASGTITAEFGVYQEYREYGLFGSWEEDRSPIANYSIDLF